MNMKELCPGYCDSIKPQKEDRELRKLVKSKFSSSTADYVLEKHRFDLVGSDFGFYAKKVKDILEQSNTREIFLSQLKYLNKEQHIAIF